MKKRNLLAASALIVALTVASIFIYLKQYSPSRDAAQEPWQPISINTRDVLVDINRQRKAGGVSPLKENTLLEKSAAAKCQDMITRGYYDHVGPGGTQPWDFFDSVGYKYNYAGENLQEEDWDGVNAQQVVDGWMNSAPHKHAMLSPDSVDTGLAVCNDAPHSRAYIVEHFGSPR